ncbi:TIGR04283 family arsenosugar biosynthesis glycosyltransferase [Rhodopirellula sp. JC740]|uniref:TIGR04283 family arsenosugar biosynthesis glycosyltransferase n=1 Tax=Rhodopirellula halodulae TaxID=2894198 RepID=A0ABS8NB51_9BACT|nr:TIGR04283 family arsenosugar biosynthesis glycosyltransferase [Rhodopirellula sp. JC740]MCC9640789.1 TIGR04283 family arsenosugar biosynthesis glycosyltransferase [Rhodopirellula sp. JC740]
MKVSVVIPTWNEAGNIAECVRSALQCGVWEVIVSDGGSQDDTLAVVSSLQESRVKLLRSDPGRGVQLRTGANHATGEMLLFLHADNRLPSDALEQLAGAGWPKWGGYRQRIDAKGIRFRLLEWGNAYRGRSRSNLFGDQAIFVQRGLYEAVGGFAPVSLMEDVMLSAELRKHSPATLLPGPVSVDARRWKQRGVVRQTLLNWRIQRAFAMGATPDELRQIYDG